jgi:signal peptidase
VPLTDTETLRRVANVLGVLLLIGAVAPFVVYGAPQVVGADHGFVVLSGSMEPAMSPGDAIIVREAAPGEISEDDVITFGTGGETPTTHRVIDVVERDGSTAYVTKGDANEDPDTSAVRPEQVVGKVLFVIPFIGYVVRFVNTGLGFGILVAAPMALIVLSELWRLLRSVDRGPDSGGDAESDVGDTSVEHSAGGDTRADRADVDSGAPPDSGDPSFTLTRSSVQLLAVVFGLYVPYSAYVAYTTVEAWSVAAAVATGTGFLFSVGLYLHSGASDADERASDASRVPAGADETAPADHGDDAGTASETSIGQRDVSETAVSGAPSAGTPAAATVATRTKASEGVDAAEVAGPTRTDVGADSTGGPDTASIVDPAAADGGRDEVGENEAAGDSDEADGGDEASASDAASGPVTVTWEPGTDVSAGDDGSVGDDGADEGEPDDGASDGDHDG